MSNQDGGPAFPALISCQYDEHQGKSYPDYSEAGMTLRDYFAAQALAGMLANSNRDATNVNFMLKTEW